MLLIVSNQLSFIPECYHIHIFILLFIMKSIDHIMALIFRKPVNYLLYPGSGFLIMTFQKASSYQLLSAPFLLIMYGCQIHIDHLMLQIADHYGIFVLIHDTLVKTYIQLLHLSYPFLFKCCSINI